MPIFTSKFDLILNGEKFVGDLKGYVDCYDLHDEDNHQPDGDEDEDGVSDVGSAISGQEGVLKGASPTPIVCSCLLLRIAYCTLRCIPHIGYSYPHSYHVLLVAHVCVNFVSHVYS